MKRVIYHLGIPLAICALFIASVVPWSNSASAIDDSIDINVTVPPRTDIPSMELMSPINGSVVNVQNLVVSVIVENVTKIAVYVDGEFVKDVIVPSLATSIVDIPITLPSIGNHEIKLVAYDTYGIEAVDIEKLVEVSYDPNLTPPDTGGAPDANQVRVGGITIGQEDHLFIYTIVAIAAVGFVIFLITKKRNDTKESKQISTKKQKPTKKNAKK